MFILYGDRRINISLLKQYKPNLKGDNYTIDLIYSDDKKESLYFFKNKKDRDDLLKKLDNDTSIF